MPPDLIALSDERAWSVPLAGAKAAHLARALAAGFPVLKGLVVPAAVSQAALVGALAAAETGSVHGAQLTVPMPDADQFSALHEAARGLTASSLVVRSSSALETSARWAGAFTSFLDIRHDELLLAIRGVWASAVSPGVIERASAEGVAVADLSVAVLIQPFVAPEFGGTAIVERDQVAVRAVAGSPAAMLAGWEPGASGDRAIGLLGQRRYTAIVDLGRAVAGSLGCTLIEWGWADGPILLQASVAEAEPVAPPALSRTLPRSALRAAAHLIRFAGSIGEGMIVPLILPDAPVVSCAPPVLGSYQDATAAWLDARRLAAQLLADRFPAAADPAAAGRQMLARLRKDPVATLASLADLPPLPADLLGQLVAQFGALGRWLTAAGRLRQPDQIWSLAPGQLDQLLADPPESRPPVRPSAPGTRRWDGFVYDAVMSGSSPLRGEAAVDGTGAGPVRYVDGGGRDDRDQYRPVLVARHPLSRLAPLLWNAAALVTFGGSAGAHLVEVAASVGVPAVVACAEAEGLFADPRLRPELAAVDGSAGVVAFATSAAPGQRGSWGDR
jgi:phosphohistidine swiveling domain-containing protein